MAQKDKVAVLPEALPLDPTGRSRVRGLRNLSRRTGHVSRLGIRGPDQQVAARLRHAATRHTRPHTSPLGQGPS